MLAALKSTLLTLILALGLALVTLAPAGAEPSDAEKLELKAAVLDHIEAMTHERTYHFVDGESLAVRDLRFVAMHPVVFERADGTYALCADFEATDGEKVLVDYFLRRLGDELVVLASVEGKRSLLMRMAERFNL